MATVPDDLQALAAWMRLNGVTRCAHNGIELELGPPAAPATTVSLSSDESADARAEREEEDDLKVLLHSSGASILPFLTRKRA